MAASPDQPSPEACRAVALAEIARDRELIKEGNSKAAHIATLTTFVIGFVGIVIATEPEVQLGRAAVVGLWVAGIGLLGVIGALIAVWWPHIKGLPYDLSIGGYEARLKQLARQYETGFPDSKQGLRLQEIARSKHYAIRVAFVAFGLLVASLLEVFIVIFT